MYESMFCKQAHISHSLRRNSNLVLNCSEELLVVHEVFQAGGQGGGHEPFHVAEKSAITVTHHALSVLKLLAENGYHDTGHTRLKCLTEHGGISVVKTDTAPSSPSPLICSRDMPQLVSTMAFRFTILQARSTRRVMNFTSLQITGPKLT
mmetsp:Transcript_23874/g.51960  ORF Transcript_23874/g.51960 Transcript_23874/m.51960 type:complete len:150 (-) Transcript_23874:995-1444(-)